jgi:hypothetical protein
VIAPSLMTILTSEFSLSFLMLAVKFVGWRRPSFTAPCTATLPSPLTKILKNPLARPVADAAYRSLPTWTAISLLPIVIPAAEMI